MEKVVNYEECYEASKNKEVRKVKTKSILKKVAVGAAVVGAGFMGYKIGRRAGIIQSGCFLNAVLTEHPELEESFNKAAIETFENHTKK